MKRQMTWALGAGIGSLILLLMLVSCTGVAPGTAVNQAGPQGATGPQGPAGPQGEPGADGQSFYAPGAGIQLEITDVTIGSDRIPVVTFTLADENGIPLSRDQVESVRFVIAHIEVDEETGLTRYFNYFTRDTEGAEFRMAGAAQQPAESNATQPTYEAGEGEFAEVATGVNTYTFGQALGEEYDPELTHVVGAVVVRSQGVVANALFTFVPAGGEVEVTRLVSATETCNGCHNQLAFHGGSRREFGLCVLCHTEQNVDPESGNSLNMQVMIHKIHSGSRLPSVQAGTPYYIVGFRQNLFDFSGGTWPQDTRNCTICHAGGPDSTNFQTAPNTAACTSCHDDVNLATGENHTGGDQEDGSCSNCHQPEGEEFDASITGAHTIPRNSQQVTGLNFEIVSVEGAVPGGSPEITFIVTDYSGKTIAPADMGYLAVTLAGPTTDYTNRVTETIFRASEGAQPPAVEEAGGGAYRYTFTYKLPADATGTYGVGMEGYVMQTLDGVEDPVRITAFNPVTYVALDGSEPAPRRQVVDRELCNACHRDLALHGTIRQNTEYCVMCHNPMASDEERRPAEAMPPTSINFRVLIHRIHRGEEATQPLEVYGFGGNALNFGEVVFPGNLAACETCHLEGTYGLPLGANVLPTVISQSDRVVSSTLPIRSVCTTCHDSGPVAGHIELQTTASGVETCTVCHGAGKEFDVQEVHR